MMLKTARRSRSPNRLSFGDASRKLNAKSRFSVVPAEHGNDCHCHGFIAQFNAFGQPKPAQRNEPMNLNGLPGNDTTVRAVAPDKLAGKVLEQDVVCNAANVHRCAIPQNLLGREVWKYLRIVQESNRLLFQELLYE